MALKLQPHQRHWISSSICEACIDESDPTQYSDCQQYFYGGLESAKQPTARVRRGAFHEHQRHLLSVASCQVISAQFHL